MCIPIHAFPEINDAAIAAISSHPDKIRMLVSSICGRLLSPTTRIDSFSERVVKAEIACRAGSMSAITEDRLTDVANSVVTAAQSPPWLRFTVAQLHFVRVTLRPYLPALIMRETAPSDMSPAETLFLAIWICKGIFDNPREFEAGPEQWLANMQQTQLGNRTGNVRSGGSVSRTTSSERIEHTLIADAHARPFVQSFFDALGFPRDQPSSEPLIRQ